MRKLKSLERLEDSLQKLPSVGRKSAERMAFSILFMSKEEVEEFANSLMEVKKKIKTCPKCHMICEDDVCEICTDDTRDKTTLMVVSYPKDVFSIENSQGYHGLYHVLNGEISISKGVNTTDINIPSLLERVKNENIKEVILATNPTIDGETTALYIAKILSKLNIQVTRLAYGLPMGANIDYADEMTLLKALQGRIKL